MKKDYLKPKLLIKQGNSYYLPVLINSYVELAQMQKGLLLVLTQLRDVSNTKQSNEGIYWLARILQSSIQQENYELLEQLHKQEE